MSSQETQTANVLLVGGCGHWAAHENHVPAILRMKRDGWNVRIPAICDVRDPYDHELLQQMPHLRELVALDSPLWIKPEVTAPYVKLKQHLDHAHAQLSFNIVIIACDPVHHYGYLRWATENGVHVLCDKPLLSREDAAWDPDQAAQVERDFEEILRMHRKQRVANGHMIALPLRRRANDVFVHAARSILDVYEDHKQNLTFGHFVVNGGNYRFPEEYELGNAHGYRYGIGSLAFSSYHYIDLIAWFLQIAPGDVAALRIKNHYVRRLGDYLSTEQNNVLLGLLKDRSEVSRTTASLSDRAKRSEMDFAFSIELIDSNARNLGMLAYTFASNSFSQRSVGLLKQDAERNVAFREKGRMSQYVIDLSQGHLQHIRISKNDAVGEPYRIRLEERRNPTLPGGGALKEHVFDDAHDGSSVTPQDVTQSFIQLVMGRAGLSSAHERISFIEDQLLTHNLYTSFYKLIAARHVQSHVIDDAAPENSEFLELV
ncbi:Gfo/Idh/MocA family oxidoreductase [Streptomyces sp. NPDC051658]|uniref:Gfo/Idh/MocA family oxidoreductase n=1 Tax=Streptomyces sp. NPDC051658 TaxID=3365667 RepID=UPI0037B61C12